MAFGGLLCEVYYETEELMSVLTSDYDASVLFGFCQMEQLSQARKMAVDASSYLQRVC